MTRPVLAHAAYRLEAWMKPCFCHTGDDEHVGALRASEIITSAIAFWVAALILELV